MRSLYVGSFGVIFCMQLAGIPPLRAGVDDAVGWTLLAIALSALICLPYSAYRLKSLLGSRHAWAWAVGLLVPFANIVILFLIDSHVNKWLKSHKGTT